MLCLRDEQITRTPHVEMAQIVQRPMRRLVPLGRVPTARTRLPAGVATVGDALGRGQVCGGGDPGAWVGAVLPWTQHRVALLAPRFGPALYAKRLLGATRCSRYSLVKCPISHLSEGVTPWGHIMFSLSSSCSHFSGFLSSYTFPSPSAW